MVVQEWVTLEIINYCIMKETKYWFVGYQDMISIKKLLKIILLVVLYFLLHFLLDKTVFDYSNQENFVFLFDFDDYIK